jgi:hypothetical protein
MTEISEFPLLSINIPLSHWIVPLSYKLVYKPHELELLYIYHKASFFRH